MDGEMVEEIDGDMDNLRENKIHMGHDKMLKLLEALRWSHRGATLLLTHPVFSFLFTL